MLRIALTVFQAVEVQWGLNVRLKAVQLQEMQKPWWRESMKLWLQTISTFLVQTYRRVSHASACLLWTWYCCAVYKTMKCNNIDNFDMTCIIYGKNIGTWSKLVLLIWNIHNWWNINKIVFEVFHFHQLRGNFHALIAIARMHPPNVILTLLNAIVYISTLSLQTWQPCFK